MSDWVFRLRSQGTWSLGYDAVVAGDFDRDGDVDELFVWDRDSGYWVVQSTVNYTPRLPVERRRSTVGYDEIIVGDFDGDGFLNDLFIWDHDTGNWVIQSMSGFRPTYRFQRHLQHRSTT